MYVLLLMCATFGEAEAKKSKKEKEGVNITITVFDEETKQPLTTARIKHPLEALPHLVHPQTGQWKESTILLEDGRTLNFTPGTTLQLDISAPQYMTQNMIYEVSCWRNNIDIYLEKLSPMEELEDIIIPAPVPIDMDEERDTTIRGE